MGFYLPALESAAPKPRTVGEDPNNRNQRKNILGAMRASPLAYKTDLRAATVNLVKPSVKVGGVWALKDAGNAEATDGKFDFLALASEVGVGICGGLLLMVG